MKMMAKVITTGYFKYLYTYVRTYVPLSETSALCKPDPKSVHAEMTVVTYRR